MAKIKTHLDAKTKLNYITKLNYRKLNYRIISFY
jgi:hypothetical protein